MNNYELLNRLQDPSQNQKWYFYSANRGFYNQNWTICTIRFVWYLSVSHSDCCPSLMLLFSMLQTVNIGIKRLLSFGMLVSGFMTAAFGYIHYIAHDQTTMYTVAGFGIRTIQAAGNAAIFTTVSTLITELFPEHSTLMLVSDINIVQ